MTKVTHWVRHSLPPRLCLKRYAPLTPAEAREGVKRMLDGRRLHLSYDDVREDAPDEVSAVEEWCELVRTSAAVRR